MDVAVALRGLLAALLVITNEEAREVARTSADRLYDRLGRALASGNRIAVANEVRAIERFLTQVLSYEEGPGTAAETCADVHDWLLQGGFLPKVAAVMDGLPGVVRVTTLSDVSGLDTIEV